jgi:hypothetical protein
MMISSIFEELGKDADAKPYGKTREPQKVKN